MNKLFCLIFGHNYWKHEGWRQDKNGNRHTWKSLVWKCDCCGETK